MTTEDIFTVLRAYIMTLIPGPEVVQGFQNGVSMPAGPFISMQALRQARLATNETSYNYVDQKVLTNFKRFDVQLDFYGPLSGDQSNVFTTAFRDDYAVTGLGPYVTPLYCGDEIHGPLTNAEKQYEDRWIVVASLEFNPDVALPQDFMDVATVVPVNVEATYQ